MDKQQILFSISSRFCKPAKNKKHTHGQATHSYGAKTVIAKPHTMSLRCLARVPQGARATEYEAVSAPGHLVRQPPPLTSRLSIDLWLNTHCLQFVYFISVLMHRLLTSLFSQFPPKLFF